MDPVGIAGLTIAVLDQLWKIGNGTAELISNYRDFDSVCIRGAGVNEELRDWVAPNDCCASN
jgi:hypothetical protein